jgi:hypothetical protein
VFVNVTHLKVATGVVIENEFLFTASLRIRAIGWAKLG